MATKNLKTVTIKTNEENPQPLELIAEAIISLSAAVKKLDDSRLKERAIILLLHDASGCTQTTVKNVLWAVRNLESKFIKPKVK